MDWRVLDDLTIERAARATWRMEHRRPDGSLRGLSEWRDLAPAIKQRERDAVRERSRQLRAALDHVRTTRTPATKDA